MTDDRHSGNKDPDLSGYLQRIADLVEELQEVGLVLPGSVVRRFMQCGTAGCRCRADPPERHGPYYEWTRKVRGRTVSKWVSEKVAETFLGWIKNRRRLRKVVSEIERIGLEASEEIIRAHASKKDD